MPHTQTKIGLATATAVCLNAMIGSGIFTAPAAIASQVGPAGILAYLFVGIAVWCLALSFARLAQLLPHEGSFYIYTRAWAGHYAGLLAAALYLFGLTVAMGMLGHVCSFYLADLLPMFSAGTLGLGTIGIIVLLNIFGVVLSQVGQQILLVCTLFPLIAISILCLMHAQWSNFVPFAPYGFGNILSVTRVVIFGFLGFECASSLYGIVENAYKNVPRAISYSIGLITLIYMIFVSAIISAVPLHLLQDLTVPLSTTLSSVFGWYGILLYGIHLAILSSILGTLHSMIWSASTLLHSIAHKINLVRPRLNCLSTSTQQKIMVLIIGSAIATNYILFDNLNLFFSLSMICIIAAFCLSITYLLFVPEEWKSGRNSITIIGLTTATIIAYFSLQGLLQAWPY